METLRNSSALCLPVLFCGPLKDLQNSPQKFKSSLDTLFHSLKKDINASVESIKNEDGLAATHISLAKVLCQFYMDSGLHCNWKKWSDIPHKAIEKEPSLRESQHIPYISYRASIARHKQELTLLLGNTCCEFKFEGANCHDYFSEVYQKVYRVEAMNSFFDAQVPPLWTLTESQLTVVSIVMCLFNIRMLGKTSSVTDLEDWFVSVTQNWRWKLNWYYQLQPDDDSDQFPFLDSDDDEVDEDEDED